jgi:hypothetical protein
MEDDIILIFSRVNDRIDNIISRLSRFEKQNQNINTDLTAI